jgi:hypothetical protein
MLLAMVDDDEEDAPEHQPIDPFSGWRRLAQAIVLQAIVDSKQRNRWARKDDADRFLYWPNDHFDRLAQCAGMDLAWLHRCLARTVDDPMPRLKHCLKCRSPFPPNAMAGRYCTQCREATPRYPLQVEGALRRQARLRAAG